MSLTPKQLYDASKPITDVYSAIELKLLINIAKRLNGTLDELSENPMVWQSARLAEAQPLLNENRVAIFKNSPIAERELLASMKEISMKHLEQNEKVLQQAFAQGLLPVSPTAALANDAQVLTILATYNGRAKDRLNSINTTMLSSSQQVYRNIISQSTARVLTGQATAQQAIRSTLSQWNDKGIPVLTRKNGSVMSAEGYVSMIVRTVTNDVTHDMQSKRNEEYESDLIEITSHEGARPKCAEDQGKVFSVSGSHPVYPPWSSSSYGEPDGILGINCGHQDYPFFEGISQRTSEPTEDREENDRIYKESQDQRRYEREIRKAKHREDILKQAGDAEGAQLAGKLVRQRQSRMRDFIDDSGRTRRYGRERIQRRK
ncbi:phage minor capsid protein [Paenisporosarcina sp. TG-14]|uniref:phage minor capsid protein n=1 Tax=Paenisporosarcina sp. TG-14 TaxID=1231057 RepID=UPI00030440AC|nr:phage minor capsid protein [Paenisporosarcina sp. TG-14]